MSVVNPICSILARTSSSIIARPLPLSSPKNLHELFTRAKSLAETRFKMSVAQSRVNCVEKSGQWTSNSCWRSKWHARWRVVTKADVIGFEDDDFWWTRDEGADDGVVVLFDLRRRLVAGKSAESSFMFQTTPNTVWG